MTTGMGGSALEVEIDFKRMEVYECGAILLTTLVYPTDQSAVGNSALFRSLCAKALWSKHLMNPDDESPITVNPRYVFLDTDIVKRNVRVVEKRLGERMVAARMAIAFLKANDTEAAATLPAELSRVTLDAVAGFVKAAANQEDSKNVTYRFWKPSRPVIHLAAAAAIIGQRVLAPERLNALEAFLLFREYIEAVVSMSRDIRDRIAQTPKFPVKAEALIQFRLG
jgi:hypothetical protein